MMHNDKTMYIASRGQGKTFLTALFCVCMAILYPRTKIVVAAPTKKQGIEIISKINDDFMKLHTWGSELLCREITDISLSINDAHVYFKSGSWIKVVTANDNARSGRANVLVCDEFVKIDQEIIDTVLKPFLTAPRNPGYLDKPEYAHLSEDNKELYMSSAWYQSHWSYDLFKSFFANMLDDTKKYFICDLPYQLPIREGLLKKKKVEDDMSEATFDEVKFSMEYGGFWFGNTDGSFFSMKDVEKQRKLRLPFYPPSTQIASNKSVKFNIPDLVANERRILSVDIALMASRRHKNDATAVFVNSAIPTNDNKYIGNIVYCDAYEGKTTDELALIIRRMFDDYKCTDLVIDSNGVGMGVLDLLLRDVFDAETGKVYPALSCCNNKDIADRCKVNNAQKVIWAIKANAQFNTEICTALRSGLQNRKLNLLVPEDEAEKILEDKYKINKLNLSEKALLMLPYIQTTFLMYELINLNYEVKGTNIKIIEQAGKRKDRYSSLAYNYWVMNQIEREELQSQKTGFSIDDFADSIKRMNKRPTMY